MSKGNRKGVSINQKQLHLIEVNSLCPLCGDTLMKERNKSIVKNYEIAHIYPSNPTESDLRILQGIEVDEQAREDFDNKIALCLICHKDYDQNKTLEKYNELVLIKKERKSLLDIKQELAAENVEDSIRSLLKKISCITDELDCAFDANYNAHVINDKIEPEYFLLRRKIRNDVAEYYTFIQEEFKNNEQVANVASFDKVRSRINMAYISARDKIDSKDEMFNALVDWLQSKTNSNRTACEILISFFVQSCEVYDYITK